MREDEGASTIKRGRVAGEREGDTSEEEPGHGGRRYGRGRASHG